VRELDQLEAWCGAGVSVSREREREKVCVCVREREKQRARESAREMVRVSGVLMEPSMAMVGIVEKRAEASRVLV